MKTSKHLSRRQFVKWSSSSLALFAFPGCGDNEVLTPPREYTPPMTQPTSGGNTTLEVTLEQIEAWESVGVLTPNEPGDWAEKIVGHYPIMRKRSDQVSVLVPHPMNEDHYIEAIYVKGSDGSLLASQSFSPNDEIAFAEFTITETIDLTVYAVCNLHQVWSAPVVKTIFEPGPWTEKVIGHTPKVLIVGDQATVSVPHPMGEDHYIVGLYLTDQNGSMIGKTQLNPNDEATYTFTIPEDVTEVQPWSLCDDHDLWIGQTISLDDIEYMNQWELNGTLTADEPGQWADKIAGHYPIVSIYEQMVTVQVAHPMDIDHYIEAIYLKDSNGHLVGFKQLSPNDEPSAQFYVIDPSTEYKAYAMCNLHEVWTAPIVRSGERPGPWTEKVNAHTPSAEVSADGTNVTVSVPHPMDEEHYIVALYLSDSTGKVIAKKQLNPLEHPEAQYTFDIPANTTVMTPWALCDDHDLWMGSSVNVS